MNGTDFPPTKESNETRTYSHLDQDSHQMSSKIIMYVFLGKKQDELPFGSKLKQPNNVLSRHT